MAFVTLGIAHRTGSLEGLCNLLIQLNAVSDD